MKTKLTILLTVITFGLSASLDSALILDVSFDGSLVDNSSNSVNITNNGGLFAENIQGQANASYHPQDTTYGYFIDSAAVKKQFPLSISAWVKIDSGATEASNIIFTSDNTYDNYTGYWLTVLSSGELNFGYGGGLGGCSSGNRRSFLSTNTVSFGEWHQVVVVVNAYDDIKMYIDCVESSGSYSGTGATTITYMNNASRIGSWIGCSTSPNGFFYDGNIDALKIWNQALDSTDVASLCDSSTISLNSKTLLKEKYCTAYMSGRLLNLNCESDIENMSIVSLKGEEVFNVFTNSSNAAYDLSALSPGLYIVVVNTSRSRYITKIVLH